MPQFDSAQKEVIGISGGEHLVLAPPGCGKTAILTERVRQALENGASPGDMLCLTFTNRAARGMEERVQGEGISTDLGMFIGNTHRYCSQLLFDNSLVERSTEIIDEETVNSILEEIAKESLSVNSNEREISKALLRIYNLQHLLFQFESGMPNSSVIYSVNHASDGLRELCEAAGLPAKRSSVISIYRNPEETVSEDVFRDSLHSLTLEYLRLARAYNDYKTEHHLLDFDDLLLKVYDYLIHNPGHRKYPWIQIDEIQDLNALQIAIVDELAAENGTIVYLGDEQQAIFSFMGADYSTLRKIMSRCGERIHRLENNYRSPDYIIDMLNEYAVKNFGTLERFLPKATLFAETTPENMSIVYSRDTRTLPKHIADLVLTLPENERKAIIVATNAAADEVSSALRNIPHFKISGIDYFCTPETSALLSLVSVINNECSPIAWSRLLFGIRLAKDLKTARKAVHTLFSAGISPADLLRYDNESYVGRFRDAFLDKEKPMVIFDTETSGLDTHSDDIIQIAAVKTLGSRIIDKCNIFIETDKEIPSMLGDIVNPLIEEYSRQTPLPRKEGLEKFVRFSAGCRLCGHNVFYDYSILRNNLKRDCGINDIESVLSPEPFDTLTLTRLISPGLYSFKLKDILRSFNLEGENSHLADDDIMATYSLAEYISRHASAKDFIEKQNNVFCISRNFRDKLRLKIGNVFPQGMKMRDTLFCKAPLSVFVKEMANALTTEAAINLDLKKSSYFIKYLKLTSSDEPQGLREELEKRCSDLQTLREADLCDSKIIDENVYVTTLHKAKGLEFENVFIYNVTDGIFPFFYSETEEQKSEDARKLYVALSRSRKRLVLTVPRKKIVHARNGNTYTFDTTLSPFIGNIRHRFSTVNLD